MFKISLKANELSEILADGQDEYLEGLSNDQNFIALELKGDFPIDFQFC